MVKPKLIHVTLCVLLAVAFLSCKDGGERMQLPDVGISTDEQLITLINQTEPFATYTLFPRADSVTQGTLNGSHAHQPLVRVSMNAKAISALPNDTLPAGSSFPDGSIIFKEIRMNGQAALFAVIYKDRSNALAANGWLWAEYSPTGNVVYSLTRSGGGCIGCHSFEQGPQNDFVRTFERQHP